MAARRTRKARNSKRLPVSHGHAGELQPLQSPAGCLRMAKPVIGVCSWSLQPTSPDDLVTNVRAAGLRAVQLALDPLLDGSWPLDGTLAALEHAGIDVRSGMMRMRGED